MAIGRKRKPDAVKKVQGTDRPDRANPNAPTPVSDVPIAPVSLTDAERGWFEVIVTRLTAERRASQSHTEVVVMLARRLAEIEQCAAILVVSGPVYESENSQGQKMIRPHPAVAQRSEAMRHAQSLLAELGLTPASLSKVSVPQAPPAGNAFVQLVG